MRASFPLISLIDIIFTLSPDEKRVEEGRLAQKRCYGRYVVRAHHPSTLDKHTHTHTRTHTHAHTHTHTHTHKHTHTNTHKHTHTHTHTHTNTHTSTPTSLIFYYTGKDDFKRSQDLERR